MAATSLDEHVKELVEAAWLDEAIINLVWAAYEGDEALEAALADDGNVCVPQPESAHGSMPVWLNSISVKGFRGIGPQAELLLEPGPGLTLVVGRNGSGKSSFAEGLEALLTGENQRWRGRPAAWLEGWRNLHDGAAVEIVAEFQREGDNMPLSVTRTWAGAEFGGSETSVDLNGSPAKFDWLGWEGPLSTFKPFLSYNELGSMLEQKPSAIYDSLAGVLGIERLTEARDRLRSARLDAEKPGKELKKSTVRLKSLLIDHEDSRAQAALLLLSQRAPDLEELAEHAIAPDDAASKRLSQLADLEAPDRHRCETAARDLDQAVAARADSTDTDAGRAARIASLLTAAIDHHAHEGDAPCPVCGTGSLDDEWLAAAQDEAKTLGEQSAAIHAAERAVTSARQVALACITLAPTLFVADDLPVDVSDARNAWEEWARQPEGGFNESSLVDRLRSARPVIESIDTLRELARSELERLDETWRPVAAELASWVVEAKDAARSKDLADSLKQAEEFFKAAEATVRETRFAPIAERAGELWAGLRQQSNVNLERVALEGKTTTRRVDLEVTVDGTETSALGVMSQGELHALALALFLPRVTAADSPFRFVVIDDPVQAMDPARVDGLARTLVDVARDRQVIVLTHDDRLPAACRRLQLEAHVIEVDRRSGSRVSTRPTHSPARSAIDDAFALARTDRLPPELQRQTVPVHCRRAIEAATRDQVWRRLLIDGRTHAEIDELVADANKTTDLLGLMFFGRQTSPNDVYDELGKIDQSLSKSLRYLNRVVHDAPADLDPSALVRNTRKLVDAINGYQR